MEKKKKIVMSGGPGGGKTTAADFFQREMGEKVVIVPESATLLYSGGFPRGNDPELIQSAQKAIYNIQINLEEAQSYIHSDRMLICDRGTIDSAVYWPKGPEDFFQVIQSTLERELSRYDAIVFFETAAVGHSSIMGGNRFRNESPEQAIELDQKLQNIWRKHPNFYYVKHEKSFFNKMKNAFEILNKLY